MDAGSGGVRRPDAGSGRAPDDEGAFDRYHPRNVSPLVGYLATADCPFTGQVFSVAGGHVGLYTGFSLGHAINAGHAWTVGELAKELGSEAFPKSAAVTRQRLVRE